MWNLLYKAKLRLAIALRSFIHKENNNFNHRLPFHLMHINIEIYHNAVSPFDTQRNPTFLSIVFNRIKSNNRYMLFKHRQSNKIK